ncbi:uncharacterized protein LOC111260107 [Varroa jacobsoni]|uniref:Uncharacterized protein n=1 Tax=Varroa destructor TaxID=109461 RepID=A0A7M7KWG2_VARDE|nr:uncharacterized protein LOC111255246 [Varroa destructor]XP_022688341.1 uncharacterized protein LOC111260107 [Varroa jacobsoni]
MSQTAEAQLEELEDGNLGGFWGFWAGNGTLIAVAISTIIQVLLGVMLYMEGDLIGTGILCIPTCVVLPVIGYLHVQRSEEARVAALTEKSLRARNDTKAKGIEDKDVAPASGDKPAHEKEE